MSNKTSRLYEFDNFRADPAQKCLWFGAELVSLTPKAFETLLVLVEHKGRVVDKETILSRVWENTFVEESTLTQNISTLRKTLDSLHNGKKFIETVPRRGYRFVGSVHEIIGDEEIVVLESRTQTEIIAEQEIIPDSANAGSDPNFGNFRKSKPSFLTNGKTLAAAAVLVCLAVLVGAFAGRDYIFQPKPSFDERFKQIEISSLIPTGDISKIAISTDGKFIALVEKKNDLQTLFLRQIGNPKPVEIIPPTRDEFIGVTFSPDNQYIFYAAYQKFDTASAVPYSLGILYKVPILGGTRQEMARDVDSPVAFSPADDKKFAFVRQNPGGRESSLMIFDCAGSGEVKLASRKWSERFSSDGLAWSPDGKFLASAAYNSANSMELIAANAENGDQKPMLSENFKWIGQVSWLPDGSGLVFPLLTEKSPNLTAEIWIASFPGGKLRPIAGGVNGFYGIGATADSGSIMSVRSKRVSNFSVASIDDLQNASVIDKNIGDNALTRLGMSWTPDGKIVYTTSRGENSDIWLVNADGTNPIQLTSNSRSNTDPVAPPDGKYLFFISNRTGAQNIWRMNLDGTNLKQITNLRGVVSQTVSTDGKRIYFTTENDAAPLWEISADGGGKPAKFSEIPLQNPQISPDGKFIVGLSPEKGGTRQNLMITVISVAGKEIVKQFENPSNAADLAFSWRADSAAFSYKLTQNGVSNIWLQILAENSPKQITRFSTGEIFRFAWSQTGDRLAFENGTVANEIILIKDLGEK
jgi:Tol biopolymer transport system component/DNA-binding winged helix-turn-helix (wHTH) protein